VLADSYLLHEPGARFYLLVVDDLPPEVELPPGVQVVAPDELGLRSFFEMCFKYDITELCTAVKPALLSLLLTRYREPSILYFDPDILVLRPLDELKSVLAAADGVLIPHLLDPIPPDGYKPSEQDILIAGAYNLGFLALRASETSSRLLAWWADRLADACRVDPARGLFVDQRWMDLAPGLFPSLAIFRDPTYDVAYWNVHSRPPERRGSELRIADRPLAFFHFSGFDPRQPHTLSKHQTRTTVQPGSPLADLLKTYADLHRKRGHEVSSRWPYGYSRFSNGVPVSLVFRRLYLGLEAPRRQAFGNPFQVDGAASFFEWAVRPQAQLGGLNPFLEALYQVRTDLPGAFPDVRGRDREAFLAWARGPGAREMDYPPAVVPDGASQAPPARDASPSAPPVHVPAASASGVNVAGYLRNETGLGAIARGYVAALRSAGVPVALKDFSALSPNRSEDPTVVSFDETHPHPVNLICANADQHFVVASRLGDAFFRHRRNIAVWFWELPEFPAEWADRFAHYDEIWAPSSFIANALSAASPIPVVRMPAVLAGEPAGDRERGRTRLGAGVREFVWLFVFDFHSYVARKNPLGLIAAFKKAFTPAEPARLVIKCVNSAFDAGALRAMREAAQGHRVSIHDGYWSRDEMRDLLAACDGYASLHRSEGLGVPLATAMSLGRPVVATDWSGNTDFMNMGNSFPVRYELVKLGADVGPYRAGGQWADPSVEHAAQLLRQVFEGGEEVAARTAAGKRTIATDYSVEAVARSLRKRLASIGPPAASPTPAFPADGLAPAFRPDFIPVLPTLDLETSQHGWWGRFGKRVAALLLRYHSFHQQRVNAILAGSIGDVAARLAGIAERADRNEVQSRQDAEATARALATLDSRVRQVAARVEEVARDSRATHEPPARARRETAAIDAVTTRARNTE
jgi:glycosyltransferase involved in cell wall biosynthesis